MDQHARKWNSWEYFKYPNNKLKKEKVQTFMESLNQNLQNSQLAKVFQTSLLYIYKNTNVETVCEISP